MSGASSGTTTPPGGAKRKRSEPGSGSSSKEAKGGKGGKKSSSNGVAGGKHGSKTANGTAAGSGEANPKRIAYFHDLELSTYEHGRAHKFRPFRAKLAHQLINGYGAYKDLMEVLRPRLVTRTDMGQYHSDAYLEILATAQATANKRFGWAQTDVAESEDPLVRRKIEEVFQRFNVELDPQKSGNAIFPGVLDYCRLYTTGSLGCAARLCAGTADVAINWYGGMCHARGSRAAAGCYVNDVVLATLELLKRFKRILYINLSGVHADAVEEAFYTTSRVMTLSFHLNAEQNPREWPGTGHVDDVGVDDGEGFAINVPVDPGIDDPMLVSTFTEIVKKAAAVYLPEAIVMQCGGGFLSTERGGCFNVTEQAYADCVRVVRDLDVPLLMLGGNGSNMARTARMWAFATMVLLRKESLLKDNLIPDVVPCRYYFEPNYEIVGPTAKMPNLNTAEENLKLRRRVLGNLNQLMTK
ncbi:Histone deacetylase [Hondaea fermentalgiana]|uniref:Histone deacetylase n=1 Tax=Hondaea fermentalgiana TaxID=2315210 RepID=A0A2R5GPG3_9STRA|nr:Histone deacetylase [Hondaea fermentalgiana]|eukprot:GBG32760.1 Histone deacetylase [Hondaea fermentalgiana]